jgi:hypothetical protein
MRTTQLLALLLALAPASALATCEAGNPTNPENDCDLDGCKVSQGDCADSPMANPLASTIRGSGCPLGAALEVCDGQDNNCSGAVDEGNPGGGAACATGQSGVCGPGVNTCVAGAIACVRNVNPSAELCDGLDNNCAGGVDEGNPQGGAACGTGQQGVCAAGTRTCVAGGLTCLPTTASSTEICDGLDNDCNGAVDNGFNLGAVCATGLQGVCSPGVLACNAGHTGTTCVQNVTSSAEVCDNKDNNCNGNTDEGNPGGGAACSTGLQGVCSAGTQQCTGGALACTATTTSSAEICDGLDNDCNGAVDNGFNVGASCSTGLQGVCSTGVRACNAAHTGTICVQTVFASAEVCDGADNNCNGSSDEGNPGGGAACSTGQSGACNPGTQQCTAGALVCTRTTAPSAETCDGVDNDCNGAVDNGFNVGAACSTGLQGVCSAGALACNAMHTGTTCVQSVTASAEVCDGNDNNCNGSSDEGNPGGGAACTTSQSGVCRPGTRQCTGGMLSCVRNVNPSAEICDGLDNNCNGSVDEGFVTDADGDGVRACGTCNAPAAPLCDCNDGNNQVRPGRTELCNNIDDDCDALVDEGVSRVCYAGPGSSYAGTCPGTTCAPRGVCAGVTQVCAAGVFPACTVATPGQTLPGSELCDNLDNNCDGQTDEGLSGAACNTGQLGVCDPGTQQCNAGTLQCVRNVNPSAEICDNQDNNCDGLTDNAVPQQRCFTGPAGTFTGTCPGTTCTPRGQCRTGLRSCNGSGGWLACTGQTLPVAEVCDGLDNDCNGSNDNGLIIDADADSSRACGTCNAPAAPACDCNDSNNQVGPSRAETCNAIDDNCNAQVDEGTGPGGKLSQACYAGDAGTQGVGVCVAGAQVCNATVPGMASFAACTGQVVPSAEVCNGTDDDCNGTVDNGLIIDADSDGVLSCGSCSAPDAGACDCDDSTGQVRPGRAEACNAIDDNCNGQVDEGGGPGGKLGQNCYGGDAGTQGVGVCTAGTQACNATVPGMASFGACIGEVVPSVEVCNGLDDNCDGVADNGFDLDGDGFLSCAACNNAMNCDCNDSDPAIKPGAVELCDTIDANCNGRLDDVPTRRCFAGQFVSPDTYTNTCPGPMCQPKGICTAGTQECSMQGAWGACAGALLPANDPAAGELLCDMRDEDCDGVVDDGNFDQDNDGVKSCEGDCNDNDPTVLPGALELCDGKDNDCDTVVDGLNTGCFEGPAYARGKGLCRDGTQTCVNGVGSGVCLGQVLPAPLPDGGVPQFVADGGVNDPELTCDAKDEDCDGIVDDGFDLDRDGVTTCAGDCDDQDAFNKPSAAEMCDCKDNNCNSQIDEGNVCRAAPCHDFDFDRLTNCQGDCDDSNGAIGPQRTEVVGNGKDDDCDGAIDEDTDEDGDGYSTGQSDCDDHFAAINPGAVEVCDGFDNNCNNRVDEGFDQDGDSATTCAGDCDDTKPERSPFKLETCGNLVDDNCDGRVDEDTDADGDGVTTCQGDCNDFLAAVHPAAGAVTAAVEVCDGQDNNCNGRADEGFDVDADNVAVCFGDCDDTDANVNPNQYEVPGNSKDDNCNGKVDEGSIDVDVDGFPPMCGDCNDADPAINPHATEVCDRVDNNCDSYVDAVPGNAALCAVCFDADRDGQTNCDGDCNDADPSIYRGATEMCDVKDNDCDGDVDLDPATGLKVCVFDGGQLDDAGTDGGEDAGPTVDDAGTADADAGGEPPARNVVTTGCGCSSGADLLALVGLGVLALARRRRGVALLAAVLVLPVLGACTTALTTPPGEPTVDGGPVDTDGGADAGTDAGFIIADWPCPGLEPVEHLVELVPGTLNGFAHSRRYAVTKNEAAQLLLLDDSPANVAAFVVRRPVPTDIDPATPTALDVVASRELATLGSLPGTPLVRDRNERFSRVYKDDRDARTWSHAEVVTLAAPTTAFAVRNRLLALLSGRTAAELGTLTTGAGARAQDQVVVYLMVRLTQDDLFVAAAVSPFDSFAANQPALSDLTNGSHLAGRNASIGWQCEERTAPALKTDFIFVIDNSASMLEEQSALANAADGLFAAFERSGLDFRIGVITTDSDVLRGGGFTNQLDAFKNAVRVGIDGNGLEMGLEFALRAVRRAKDPGQPETFRVRSDAGLVVVFLTDEENAGLQSVAGYASDFVAEGAVIFGIVGPRPTGCTRVGLGRAVAGTEYIDVAARTGGSTGSICNPNITEVVEEILFGAIGASSRSPLDKRPISGSLSIETDVKVPRARSNGFDYDPGTNTVLFFGAVPQAGTKFKAAFGYFLYIG